jgi:ectoine hydroxylase-related dioxygenase (phytanoyl-CoA dioxygenase family)
MQASFASGNIRDIFTRDGFVVLPDFLDSTELVSLNQQIHEHFRPLTEKNIQNESAVQHAANFKQFECDVLAWDPCSEGNRPFLTLQSDSRLANATAACIGEGFTNANSLVMWSTCGGKGQAWHQDCPPEDPTKFNLNRLFYPQDVNLSDGAIVVVPGSHRQGRIPPGGNQEPIPGEVALTPRAGTLVLLSGHVYHRVSPNVSGKPRVSINFRVFPSGVSPEIIAVGVYRGGAYDFNRREVVT